MVKAMTQAVPYQVLPIETIQVTGNVRLRFDEDDLKGLSDSIKAHGILNPLIVRPGEEGGYALVAGERRLRAATLAGLTEVPTIVWDLDEPTAQKVQLLENLQRRDLDPLEEAYGFDALIQNHGMQAKELAKQLGISESLISNRRRLLKLPGDAKVEISRGNLSPSVALSLIPLSPFMDITNHLAKKMVERKVTQDRAEAFIEEELGGYGSSCPVVAGSYNVGTCDPQAHGNCFCRHNLKTAYSGAKAVCLDPVEFKKVEALAVAKITAAAKQAAGGKEIPDVKSLPGWKGAYGGDGRYQMIDGGRCKGDHSQCPCLIKALDGGRPVDVCTDKKAFEKIENKAVREKNKDARANLGNELESYRDWGLKRVRALIDGGGFMRADIADSPGSSAAAILPHLELVTVATRILCDVAAEHDMTTGKRRAHPASLLEHLGIDYKGDFFNRVGLAKALDKAPTASLLAIIIVWPLMAESPRQEGSHASLAHWFRVRVDEGSGDVAVRPADEMQGQNP